MPLDYVEIKLILTMVSFDASKTVHSLPQKADQLNVCKLVHSGEIRWRDQALIYFSSSPFF